MEDITGEQGRRISQVVNAARSGNESDVLRAWHAYLEQHVAFPFAAVVREGSSGPIPASEHVTVVAMVELDEAFGTIVSVKYRLDIYKLPLRDLEVTVASDETVQAVGDYEGWMGRR